MSRIDTSIGYILQDVKIYTKINVRCKEETNIQTKSENGKKITPQTKKKKNNLNPSRNIMVTE